MNLLIDWWITGIILILLRLKYKKANYKYNWRNFISIICVGLFWPLTIWKIK